MERTPHEIHVSSHQQEGKRTDSPTVLVLQYCQITESSSRFIRKFIKPRHNIK
jgi:hypothetical protein